MVTLTHLYHSAHHESQCYERRNSIPPRTKAWRFLMNFNVINILTTCMAGMLRCILLHPVFPPTVVLPWRLVSNYMHFCTRDSTVRLYPIDLNLSDLKTETLQTATSRHLSYKWLQSCPLCFQPHVQSVLFRLCEKYSSVRVEQKSESSRPSVYDVID
jgi:hypothetical protein